MLDYVPVSFFHKSMHTEKIAALRASLAKPGLEEASIRVPLGHAAADLCLKGGLVRGVLHEVFAAIGHEASATGFTAGLAARVARANACSGSGRIFPPSNSASFRQLVFWNLELIRNACCCCVWPMRREHFAPQMMRSPAPPWALL